MIETRIVMRFNELHVRPELLEVINKMGFSEMTPIQEKCIPLGLHGRDVVGQAETGSGKTIAFALPILDKIHPGKGLQALVLTPTRELCVQVTGVFRELSKHMGVHTVSVYGGVSITPQMDEIRMADVVIGTPGRILDHLGRKTIGFPHTQFLVLDETDKMFEMGFIEDVEEILGHVPKQRQTFMFSATISYDVQAVMEKHLNNPETVVTQSYVDKNKLKQVYYDIHHQNDKFSLLVHLLRNHTKGLAIVFCSTRQESDTVAKNLKHQGISAMAIHGGMSQHDRLESLDAIKTQKTNVLVATDVAARGLDIKNVTHVYNYDVPKTAREYIHRIGRTARAGEDGMAVTLLTERDHDNFRRVMGDRELNIEPAELPRFGNVMLFRGGPRYDRLPFRGHSDSDRGHARPAEGHVSRSSRDGYRSPPSERNTSRPGDRSGQRGDRRSGQDGRRRPRRY